MMHKCAQKGWLANWCYPPRMRINQNDRTIEFTLLQDSLFSYSWDRKGSSLLSIGNFRPPSRPTKKWVNQTVWHFGWWAPEKEKQWWLQIAISNTELVSVQWRQFHRKFPLNGCQSKRSKTCQSIQEIFENPSIVSVMVIIDGTGYCNSSCKRNC